MTQRIYGRLFQRLDLKAVGSD